ncbi:MAG: DUF3667 domain-containing protein [Brumimicrobium sp.]|nr:DUF3667 domain-containing protein [Brumimicrobium sp.]
MTTTCKNCGKPVSENYCAHCGEKINLPRINGTFIFSEIADNINLKKGFLYTVKELIIRPGKTARIFLLENRKKIIKPITFLIVCTFIFGIIDNFLFPSGLSISESSELKTKEFHDNEAVMELLKKSKDYISYINIIFSIFISFWVKYIFFRKHSYSFWEVAVVLFYIGGIQMLISSIFLIINYSTSHDYSIIGTFIGIIYSVWVLGQFFNGKFKSYFHAFLSILLGYLSLIIIGLTLLVFIIVIAGINGHL